MKTSEPSPERPQLSPPKIRGINPLESSNPARQTAEEEFQPRYVDAPVRVRMREQSTHGRRNLTLAVVIMVLCVPLFGWALHLGGPGMAMFLGCCLATAVALYGMARARLFRQRNGDFLALAIVCLLGVGIALAEQAFLGLSGPAAAKTPAIVENAAPAKSAATPAPPPSLVEVFMIPPPDPARGKRVRILKDHRVNIEGKDYLIRVGDVFPFVAMANGEARFLANDRQIGVPQDCAEVLSPQKVAAAEEDEEKQGAVGLPKPVAGAPAPEASGEDTKPAQREAIRRYPGIGIKGSPENVQFIAKVQEMKRQGLTEYFQDPDWPFKLANALAVQKGWHRQDIVDEDDAAPADKSAPGKGEEGADADMAASKAGKSGGVADGEKGAPEKLPPQQNPPPIDNPATLFPQ